MTYLFFKIIDNLERNIMTYKRLYKLPDRTNTCILFAMNTENIYLNVNDKSPDTAITRKNIFSEFDKEKGNDLYTYISLIMKSIHELISHPNNNMCN